jgi:signal peptide peptidase SppA
MKYQRISSYVASTLWAIHPSKLAEVLAVLAFRAAGHEFSEAEIEARIGARTAAAPTASARGAVAVIPIRGVIAHRMGAMDDTSGGTSCERIGAMIDQAAADPGIGTIVYDLDSPGGTVPGIQELAAKMFALRGQKIQIAQVNSLAASAAYWLASQCDERVCMPSGTAGSIGVYTAFEDLSKALEKEGISVELISAGKYKVEGSPFSPLSPEARAVKQAGVDAAYAQFTADVGRGLGVSAKAIQGGYGEGRALGAKDALAAGLIDRIATMDETLGRLVGRASVSGGMKAEGLRDGTTEGRQRRAYVAAVMASARGMVHVDAHVLGVDPFATAEEVLTAAAAEEAAEDNATFLAEHPAAVPDAAVPAGPTSTEALAQRRRLL